MHVHPLLFSECSHKNNVILYKAYAAADTHNYTMYVMKIIRYCASVLRFSTKYKIYSCEKVSCCLVKLCLDLQR